MAVGYGLVIELFFHKFPKNGIYQKILSCSPSVYPLFFANFTYFDSFLTFLPHFPPKFSKKKPYTCKK